MASEAIRTNIHGSELYNNKASAKNVLPNCAIFTFFEKLTRVSFSQIASLKTDLRFAALKFAGGD